MVRFLSLLFTSVVTKVQTNTVLTYIRVLFLSKPLLLLFNVYTKPISGKTWTFDVQVLIPYDMSSVISVVSGTQSLKGGIL